MNRDRKSIKFQLIGNHGFGQFFGGPHNNIICFFSITKRHVCSNLRFKLQSPFQTQCQTGAKYSMISFLISLALKMCQCCFQFHPPSIFHWYRYIKHLPSFISMTSLILLNAQTTTLSINYRCESCFDDDDLIICDCLNCCFLFRE